MPSKQARPKRKRPSAADAEARPEAPLDAAELGAETHRARKRPEDEAARERARQRSGDED